MHDGMQYGRNQGQGHSREVDRQSPMGLILSQLLMPIAAFCHIISCFYQLLTFSFFLLFTLWFVWQAIPFFVHNRHCMSLRYHIVFVIVILIMDLLLFAGGLC